MSDNELIQIAECQSDNFQCNKNTTILLPLSTRLLKIVLDVKFFHSWMDFLAIIKSISA